MKADVNAILITTEIIIVRKGTRKSNGGRRFTTLSTNSVSLDWNEDSHFRCQSRFRYH